MFRYGADAIRYVFGLAEGHTSCQADAVGQLVEVLKQVHSCFSCRSLLDACCVGCKLRIALIPSLALSCDKTSLLVWLILMPGDRCSMTAVFSQPSALHHMWYAGAAALECWAFPHERGPKFPS